MGIVTDHTTMQYGHSAARMRYSVSEDQPVHEYRTRGGAHPSVRASTSGSLTPETASTPVTSTKVKEITPKIGLGGPNTEACGVTITDPQDEHRVDAARRYVGRVP